MIASIFSLGRPADDGVYNRVDNEPSGCSQSFGDCPRDHKSSYVSCGIRLEIQVKMTPAYTVFLLRLEAQKRICLGR